MGNPQSRKWNLVINNPQEYELTREIIIDRLNSLFPNYYCLSEEISLSGTPHIHIFIYRKSPIRFHTLKNKFPSAHAEKAYSTIQENRDYVAKEGKWKGTEKEETKVEGSFYEWGKLINEREEKNPLNYEVIKDLEDGKVIGEIVSDRPELIFKVKQIEALKEALLIKNANKFRSLSVIYCFGQHNVGKTKMVYECHEPIDICRITNYRKHKEMSYDTYHGEKVLLLDNFQNSLYIDDLIALLDIFPMYLPARFYDRYSVYEYVYLLSVLPLEKQYEDIQKHYPLKWNALINKINKIIEIKETGEVIKHEKERYIIHNEKD